MKDLSLQSLTAPLASIGKAISKHHVTLVILLALGLLIFTVLSVNTAMSHASDEQYRAEQQNTKVRTSFDRATIEKLERLYDRQQAITLDLPSGRINPFTE